MRSPAGVGSTDRTPNPRRGYEPQTKADEFYQPIPPPASAKGARMPAKRILSVRKLKTSEDEELQRQLLSISRADDFAKTS